MASAPALLGQRALCRAPAFLLPVWALGPRRAQVLMWPAPNRTPEPCVSTEPPSWAVVLSACHSLTSGERSRVASGSSRLVPDSFPGACSLCCFISVHLPDSGTPQSMSHSDSTRPRGKSRKLGRAQDPDAPTPHSSAPRGLVGTRMTAERQAAPHLQRGPLSTRPGRSPCREQSTEPRMLSRREKGPLAPASSCPRLPEGFPASRVTVRV